MKIFNKMILVCVVFVLVACSSNNQATFYLLKAMPSNSSQQIELNNPPLSTFTVLVKPAKFPEYLDQPQMVLRENDFKLQITEQHRWAEPIKNDFTRVFVENLDSRITPSNARIYSKLEGTKPDYQVSIEVFQMEVTMDDQAILKVEWLLSAGKKTKLIKRQKNEYSVSVDKKSYESGVEAQSKAIALFADQMAKTIRIFHKQSGDNR